MIRYRRGSWTVVAWWWGGINRHILGQAVGYFFFVTSLYLWQQETDVYADMSREGIHSLGGFVVFLLVFRLNQSMARYSNGENCLARISSYLEAIISTCTTSLAGSEGADPSWHPERNSGAGGRSHVAENGQADIPLELLQYYQDLAVVTKVNAVRYTLAFAVGCVMHCRIVEAACESMGELNEDALDQVMFLHRRLQGYLYPEEMQLLEQAVCIGSHDGHHRVQVARHIGEAELDLVIGDTGDSPKSRSRLQHGRTTAPLPSVIMTMLRGALRCPLSKPWGYPERTFNVFAALAQATMQEVEDLNTIMSMPLPLAYLQHCRTLLFLFGFIYPLSINPGDGLMDNIFMPVFIFWALLGIEIVGELMENPLGHDETDLDLFTWIHTMEVKAKYAFDVTEAYSLQIERSFWKPLEDFHLSAEPPYMPRPARPRTSDLELRTDNSFETYFEWLPIPEPVRDGLLDGHGTAAAIHKAKLKSWTRSLKHKFQNAGRSFLYMPVLQDETEQPCETEDANRSIWTDPFTLTHYLVFRGTHGKSCRTGRALRGDCDPIHMKWGEEFDMSQKGDTQRHL